MVINYVRILQNNNGMTETPLEVAGDQSGFSVSLSADGSVGHRCNEK